MLVFQRPQLPKRAFPRIEILIPIVFVGVFAGGGALALGGLRERGVEASTQSDAEALSRAQEIHRAQHGVYATESELVAVGLLQRESSIHDIAIDVAKDTYTIVRVDGPNSAEADAAVAPVATFTTMPEVTEREGRR